MKVKSKGTAVATVEEKSLPALPNEWATELAAAAKDASAVEQPQVQSFSLKSGVLSYGGQALPGNKVEVIVLASAFENAMFINKFDPNNIVPPLCFALSPDGEDMEPHDGAYKKQNETCLGCAQAEWGSDPNSPSGKGKMCKETRRLALIPADALDEGVGKAQIALLRVPVTSVNKWSSYVQTLAATAKRPAWAVVTEISVVPNQKNQFEVNFRPVDAINDTELLTELKAASKSALAAIMTPYATMTEEQFKMITEPEEKPRKKAKF
jgi:hypothetical protein